MKLEKIYIYSYEARSRSRGDGVDSEGGFGKKIPKEISDYLAHYFM